MTRTIAQIDAEIARLKEAKRALKPVISIGPAFKRSRSFRPEGEGQRQPRERDNVHLAFIRRLPCASCGASGPCDAAHLRLADPQRGKRYTGKAEKPSDRWTTPLCRPCHERQHSGAEAAFWASLAIDPIDLCIRLYDATGDEAAAIQIIRDGGMGDLFGHEPVEHQGQMAPAANKFHVGNGEDGKHYWLTPPDLYASLNARFSFNFDPCPFPKPDDFDGLTCEWGESSYVNPPFGSIIHEGKKKGPTAWARKAIAEAEKGKRVVLVYPIDKWVLMLLAAGAKVENLGDVRWLATEDRSQGKGTGRHIACFILDGTVEGGRHG